MAQITNQTEPRQSLLIAVFLTGAALLLCAGKGWLPLWFGAVGNWIMTASIGWQLARAWYLWRGKE